MSGETVTNATEATIAAGEVLRVLRVSIYELEVRRGSKTSLTAAVTVWLTNLADLRAAPEWLGETHVMGDQDRPDIVRVTREKDGILWKFWCVCDSGFPVKYVPLAILPKRAFEASR